MEPNNGMPNEAGENGRGALETALEDSLQLLAETLERHRTRIQVAEHGVVARVTSAIALVRGLPGAQADEILRFPGDLLGVATNLDPESLGVILLGESSGLRAGDEVRRTGRVVDVPVGDQLLGRTVDPLGRALDKGESIRTGQRRPVEREAPAILDRDPVEVPLQTGIKAIDALVPIGRGQRELILGDRQIGKTAVAIDAMINQRDQSVICVYCAIGQRASSVAKVIADLSEHGVRDRSIVVFAGGDDPPGLQFMAPYAATTIAEFFMERGEDVLIVYDDLTRHARAYREVSLLLRRPPGREAYPGDIFYIHSRLLERATHLTEERGGGSLTALPIIETQAQNISAYIPTNLISITDGQVYLSPDLFGKGFLPAIDVGRSVSRVGGKAQLPAYRAMGADLRLAYSQFEELESFSRFGTRLDEDTRRKLERGRRVREILKQPQYETMPVAEQIAVLLAVGRGLYDSIPIPEIESAERATRELVREELADLAQRIEDGAELTDEDRRTLVERVRSALAEAGFGRTEEGDGDSGEPS